MEIVNWPIVRIFLKKTPLTLEEAPPPFNTVVGLNDDKINAGYIPANIPVNNANTASSNKKLETSPPKNDKDFPAKLLKLGSVSSTITTAINVARKEVKIDSPKNCNMSCFR